MSNSIETTQVTLRLSNKPEVVRTLKAKKRFQERKHNGVVTEVYVAQFDGKALDFVKDMAMTLPKTIADAIRRDNWVIIGDDLSGEVTPVFDIVRTHEIGAEVSESKPFACPLCGKDMINRHNLAKHLAGSAHATDGAGTVDLKHNTGVPKVDFDTPLEEQLKRNLGVSEDEDAA